MSDTPEHRLTARIVLVQVLVRYGHQRQARCVFFAAAASFATRTFAAQRPVLTRFAVAELVAFAPQNLVRRLGGPRRREMRAVRATERKQRRSRTRSGRRRGKRSRVRRLRRPLDNLSLRLDAGVGFGRRLDRAAQKRLERDATVRRRAVKSPSGFVRGAKRGRVGLVDGEDSAPRRRVLDLSEGRRHESRRAKDGRDDRSNGFVRRRFSDEDETLRGRLWRECLKADGVKGADAVASSFGRRLHRAQQAAQSDPEGHDCDSGVTPLSQDVCNETELTKIKVCDPKPCAP